MMNMNASTAAAKSGFNIARAVRPVQRCTVCKATEVEDATKDVTKDSVKTPEWLPAQAVPIVDFLAAKDFDLAAWEPYKKYIQKPILDDEVLSQCVGWKDVPETVNGRLAMLGFLTGGLAEIFGAGPVLQQVAFAPQPVVITIGLLMAASIIPIVKGTKGDYLESLRETYSVPEGVFTPTNERVHSRLAMIGMFGLLCIEVFKGTAVL